MAFQFWTDKGDQLSTGMPNDMGFNFGGGGASSVVQRSMGNIYCKPLAAAVNPGGVAGDYVLDFLALPAGSLDAVGRGLEIFAQGNVATGTNTKQIKLWWNVTAPVIGSLVSGGTLIADTGSYSTTGATGYSISARVFKTATLNSQLCMSAYTQIGVALAAQAACVVAAAVESGAINIAVTGAAGTTATDIAHFFMQVKALN